MTEPRPLRIPVREAREELAELEAKEVWIGVPEIAGRVGKSETTVRGLLTAGIIPCRRHGESFYVHRAEFERWLVEGQAAPAGPSPVEVERLLSGLRQLLGGSYRITMLVEPARER